MKLVELKKVELDEIELCLEIAKLYHPKEINSMNYKQIAEFLEERFNIEVNEHDINVIHEPTIEQMSYDLQLQYQNLNLM